VHDLSNMQVFEGASNRTAVFICKKELKEFAYPVPYWVWRGPSTIGQDETLQDALVSTERKLLDAAPIDTHNRNSPWLTAPAAAVTGARKAVGKSGYSAREGANTGGLNGCYWVEVVKELANGDLLVRNLHDVGKVKVQHVEAAVESDLVYPLLRGREVEQWLAKPSSSIIAPQDRVKEREGIPEAEMKRSYAKTFGYLKKFEKQLASRRDRKYYPAGSPFYTMRNMASYTLAPWKLVWREQSSKLQTAVVGPERGKPVIADHKLMTVGFKSAREAYYLSALLSSSPCKLLVASYAISTSTSTHVLEHVNAPQFEKQNSLHQHLADLSESCHIAAASTDFQKVAALEAEIDKAGAKLWGITDNELSAIRGALADTGKVKPVELDDEEDQGDLVATSEN
jgi:hypothetical protein